MAGTNADFDAAAFRAAIRSAMDMGLPNATNERATFRWAVEKTFATADPAGQPYTFNTAPASTVVRPDVRIPVAVEFSARPAGSTDTSLGEFDTSRVIITILDEDYEQVEGANEVLLGGNAYDVQFVGPPLGLFSVTVYQVYAEARDES